MLRLRTWSLVALAAAALGLASCGNSNPPASGSAGTTTTTTAAQTTTTGAAAATTTTAGPGAGAGASTIAPIPAADLSPAGQSGTAPTVIVPKSAPPTQLESTDLITGSGATAQTGNTVSVQYVLATYSSKMTIQSSWTSQSFSFTLGEGQVIPGWDKGVVGMKVGGRRELIIPPALGYGANSPGAGIAANDTLVFVIDLLKVS